MTNHETVRVVRLFVSSPGDVGEERRVLGEAVERVNETTGQANGVRLELIRWEDDVVPRIGPPPQEVVDGQTPSYDVYLGIMAAHFGGEEGRRGSGTEKEFRDALASWGEGGSPWILFYFKDGVAPSIEPKAVKQYLRVCEFREELVTKGIVDTYSVVRGASEGLFEKVEQHLRRLIQDHFSSKRAAPVVRKWAGTPTVEPTVPQAYRDWLQGRWGEVDLLGLRPKHGQAVRLHHVYVPLTTRAGGEKDVPSQENLERGLESQKPILLLNSLGKNSLYLPGAPGSGKSMFCRWAAWLACSGSLPVHEVPAPKGFEEVFPVSFRGRLPLLVPLRELWRHLPDSHECRDLSGAELLNAIGRWLAEVRPPGIDGPHLEAHLERGSALLILDGVDEVPLNRGTEGRESCPREMLLAGLAEAVPEWNRKGNRLLLTSRPYGVSEADVRKMGLPTAPIAGLDPEILKLLVHRWFRILGENPEKGASTARDLLEHVRGRPDLEPFLESPMLLTAVCIVYGEGKRLPQDRYDLYDRIVDNVLYNRFPEDPLQLGRVRSRLAVVAHGMHTGSGLCEDRASPQAEVTFGEIERMVQAFREQSSWTEPGVLDAVKAREDLLSKSGLLIPRGEKRASFYHLSFQEFLAALRLLDIESERLLDLFRRRAPIHEWHNTLSFAFAGCISASRSTSLERGIALLGNLIGGIRRHDLGLKVVAAACLELLLGKGIRLEEALEEKFRTHCLEAIEDEVKPIRDRCALGLALGHLGDPRIVLDLRDKAGYVEVPVGEYVIGDDRKPFAVKKPFRISRFPVTNAQYRLFVEDGGYQDRKWWSNDGFEWLQKAKAEEPEYWRRAEWNGPTQPVVGVSFWEAEAFAAWAGGRLPAAREWEAAARGPEGLEFPWGNDWEDGICNSREAGVGKPSPVGVFPRSRSKAFSLEDIAGNVWEWSSDVEAKEYRVVAGGSWQDPAAFCGCATTNGMAGSEVRSSLIGFRVML